MTNKEWSSDELKSKAERYCASAERCESEVRLKLLQWRGDAQTVDKIVDSLRVSGYVDDERYARAFVHDKVAFQGWGRVKIEYMLRAKKLPLPVIKSALKTIDEIEYFEQLSHLIETKSFNALLLRGFTAEEIKQCQS